MSTTTAKRPAGYSTKVPRLDVQRLLRQGLQLQAQGHHEKAWDLARQVLQVFALNTQALLLAGQSELMLQRYTDCVTTMSRLIALDPRQAMALSNRGVAYEALGQLEAAVKDYAAAIRLEPDFLDARLNHARALHRLGLGTEAISAFEAIVAQAPQMVSAWVGLGEAHREVGNRKASLEAFQHALKLDPNSGAAWLALGNAHLEFSQWEEAVEAYGHASTHLPQHALVYSNCAKALRELQQYDEAVLVTDAAIRLDPDCVPARRNKVTFLLDLNHWALAVEACAEVLRRSPNDALTHNNLGFALNALKQYEAALDAFQTATRHDTDLAIAWVNQACTLEMMNRHEEALKACEQAVRIQPDYPNLLGRIGHARLYVCDWHDATETRQRLMAAMDDGQAPCDPFRIISFSDQAKAQQTLARRWLRELVQPLNPGAWPAISAERHDGRIRIGYFSADFHHHATTLLMAQMLELHDKSKFEIIAVSFGPPREDAMRARLRRSVDAFHDIMALDDDRAAQFARELRLDIAVDLKGYTLDHRIGIFQRRVAPVQISYLGFPGTLGAPFMDYILADHTLIPDELRDFYDEKVIRIPGTYQANDTTRAVVTETPSRSALGLPEEGFVFCCFNNNYKITPEVFDVWMRLLTNTPGSVLWLLADNDSAKRNLQANAQARGVQPERLIFAPRVGWEEHLARQGAADLFLDTLPCNAHTTASDALRMGLPVLTCMGTAFASRVAASLLHAQGLDDLIVTDLAAYEALAHRLATKPNDLNVVKQKTVAAISSGALLNSISHVQHVELAYMKVIERAWQGFPADHIDVVAS